MEKIYIYSIGYTAFKIDEFITTLQTHNIQCVIDVRSSPVSEHYAEYNSSSLMPTLKSKGIIYKNYAKEFGARQEDSTFYSSAGYMDFNKFMKSVHFVEGIEKIKKGLSMGCIFCLMCAETDPINCHRSIMVGRGLKKNGIIVNHIMKDKTIQTQDEIEQRLLDCYFKNRNQLSLFDAMKSEEEMIEESYNIKNNEIGYRKEKI